MFIGEYQHSIDGKGRIAIPAKFRRDLEDGVVIARGVDSCLYVYPKNEWMAFAEKISKLPINQAKYRAFSRHTLGGAMDTEFDAQGRILISDYLRQYAGIKEKAVIVGQFNRLEVWDEHTWHAYKTENEKRSAEIAEELGDIA